jgi:hypothetical protein
MTDVTDLTTPEVGDVWRLDRGRHCKPHQRYDSYRLTRWDDGDPVGGWFGRRLDPNGHEAGEEQYLTKLKDFGPHWDRVLVADFNRVEAEPTLTVTITRDEMNAATRRVEVMQNPSAYDFEYDSLFNFARDAVREAVDGHLSPEETFAWALMIGIEIERGRE